MVGGGLIRDGGLGARLDHQYVQTLDILHCAAWDTLKVPVKSGGRVEHAPELFLALGPQLDLGAATRADDLRVGHGISPDGVA
jgi:hypothetical protein